jgi:predicted RNA binding protein YcfA (HicA-like mRNA interferase family)
MTGKQLMELLRKNGWKLDHIRGSHHIMRKNGRIIVVPVHAGKDLGKGIVKKIFKEAGLK